MAGIANYGLFWQRDQIFWGSPGSGNQGHLKGWLDYKSNKYVNLTDFRHQSGVYLLQDDQRNIKYVGQAGKGNRSLFDRLKDHHRGNRYDRWSHFSWFGLLQPVLNDEKFTVKDVKPDSTQLTVKAMLNQFEGILIQTLEPPLNAQGASWGNTERYYQYISDETETHDRSNDKLMEKLEEILVLLNKGKA